MGIWGWEGTYSNTTGAINNFDCFDCDPGFYCSNAFTPGKFTLNKVIIKKMLICFSEVRFVSGCFQKQ